MPSPKAMHSRLESDEINDTVLAEDEEQADLAFERLVRVIDTFRDGSTVDLDRSDAIRMAESIRRHLRERTNSVLPKPRLLSDNEDQPDVGLPFTLKELEVLDHVEDGVFPDFRDERDYIVHSLGSFLTVWTSVLRDGVLRWVAGCGGSPMMPLLFCRPWDG